MPMDPAIRASLISHLEQIMQLADLAAKSAEDADKDAEALREEGLLDEAKRLEESRDRALTEMTNWRNEANNIRRRLAPS